MTWLPRLLVRCLALWALAACAPLAPGGLETSTRAVSPEQSSFGPIASFSRAYPEAPQRANSDMARDFLDLHFELESGRQLTSFSRFDGDITLRVIGRSVPTLQGDLDRLLKRLRREAGLTITQVSANQSARITVEVVPASRIQRILPNAACFVVPNVSDLSDYFTKRRAPAVDWTRLTQRDTAALFLPADISPQELRDCLHEELAQALGPLNDLYRLPDSVFNDDNVHTVLTGFDMLMLKTAYSSELSTGMTRAQVAARLPGILARLNPAGQYRASRPLPRTPETWKREIEVALGPDATFEQRLSAADSARRIAIREGWRDHRLAFSEYSLGLLMQSYDGRAAQARYAAALRAIGETPGTAIHRSMITVQTAAFALATGRSDKVIDQTNSQIPVAQRHENAVVLAMLMLLQSQALAFEGKSDAADRVRLDSLGWARYGFGSDRAIQARMDDVATLASYGSGLAAQRTN